MQCKTVFHCVKGKQIERSFNKRYLFKTKSGEEVEMPFCIILFSVVEIFRAQASDVLYH